MFFASCTSLGLVRAIRCLDQGLHVTLPSFPKRWATPYDRPPYDKPPNHHRRVTGQQPSGPYQFLFPPLPGKRPDSPPPYRIPIPWAYARNWPNTQESFDAKKRTSQKKMLFSTFVSFLEPDQSRYKTARSANLEFWPFLRGHCGNFWWEEEGETTVPSDRVLCVRRKRKREAWWVASVGGGGKGA